MNHKHPVYAAACQVDLPNPKNRDEMHSNTAAMAQMMEHAVQGYSPFFDVRLVVFPEFAHAAPVYFEVDELLEKLAIPAENEHVDVLAAKARELGCYVQTGSFLEVDARWPDRVFNTSLLLSPDGEVLSRYRKANPWIPWEVHSSPHDIPDYPDDIFPVVETEIGRLGVATCYDWLFPEVLREMTLKGAEVLIRISAYMDPWGATSPMDWWTIINRARAIENVALVVAANQGASHSKYPPFSWPGGSMIVDGDGRILAEAPPGPGERIVVAPIDVGNLRRERDRRVGHMMPAHLRSSMYPLQREDTLRPVHNAAALNADALERRIQEAKRQAGLTMKEGENQ